MVVAIGVVVAAILGAGVYFDRKNLKADVESKLAVVRSAIKADVALVVADVKTWAEKEAAQGKDVVAQFEARLKQIL